MTKACKENMTECELYSRSIKLSETFRPELFQIYFITDFVLQFVLTTLMLDLFVCILNYIFYLSNKM